MAARTRSAPRDPVNVRLPADVDRKIARFARLTSRTKSAVIVGAVVEHPEWRIRQQRDLEKGLAEARAGKFVAHGVVVGKLKKPIKTYDR